ncbi:transglutaminase TgpA family protein [Virgibacillus halodenitrificans]|uniref:transglutaminase TgpA family protein n=1 Tax=Virgibacillus halodenitrificans TaxID=1482 RepID=UPI0002FAAE59|nr:transglutaminase domain-containing protein [Virgibacillus halodenitrificans]
MSTANGDRSIIYSSLLYTLGFLLFLEWLYPVEDITDTGSLTIFILYALFCFAISMIQIKWWISFLLKGMGLFIVVNALFIEAKFLGVKWFSVLFGDLFTNVEALFSQQFFQFTPLFRSVLFLLLIWLMSYLLYYWFVIMKRIFLFVLLTFTYIAVLDTFTVYDATLPIIRTFILGFLALGIANFMKELRKEAIHFSWLKKTTVWLVPLIVIVFLSTIIGYGAPKFDSQWADPVPFIKSKAENAGMSDRGSSIQKVGYGEDDSRLGGSFVQDYTPVFQAAVTDEHYWRIETKDTYTGKGWETSDGPDYQQIANQGMSFRSMFEFENVETETMEAMIEFQGNTSIKKLIYPYGTSQVFAAGVDYFLDPFTSSIEPRIENEAVVLDNYTISYDNPSFAINELRKADQTTNEDIENPQYTQLPDTLPERVYDLAEEITASYDNRYDKAKAIERYFSSNGFEYQTTDVPVPKANQDYVDQFLFDSKMGYCDNYSTSMVVMLRSLGIPARWTKGFTSGEIIQDEVGGANEETFDIYEVTNANAHSWVEVYFPENGWVPFEPTQGFSNLADFRTEINNDVAQQEEEMMETPDKEEEEAPKPDELPKDVDEDLASASDQPSWDFSWQSITILLLIISLLGYLIYKTRFRWKTHFILMKFRKHPDSKNYQEAYHHLMRVLEHKGLGKKTDETLREYARKIDVRYTTDEMWRLTSQFENILYHQQQNKSVPLEVTQLWKNLIKRIMA